MKLLTAVNLTLPKLGEHPVTRLDQKHPTLAILLPEVENQLRVLCSHGWWFNSYEHTFYPDNEKHIFVGTDLLSFVPCDDNCAVRGEQLFNTDTVSFEFDAPVKGWLVELVEFDLLPESASQVVYNRALVNTYITDLGMTNDVQAWQAAANSAASDLLAEHLRHRKYSTARSRRFRRLRSAMRS